jgi:hypothetical protein
MLENENVYGCLIGFETDSNSDFLKKLKSILETEFEIRRTSIF